MKFWIFTDSKGLFSWTAVALLTGCFGFIWVIVEKYQAVDAAILDQKLWYCLGVIAFGLVKRGADNIFGKKST